jgi:monoamine oxidase
MQTMKKRSRRPHSARTPLFKSLRRLFGLANLANERNTPPADELVEMPLRPSLNRREFLRVVGTAAVAVGAGSWLTGCAAPRTGPNAPRIAIVGGGISGLNAAYKLKRHGLSAGIYEASKRTGGRIYTAKDLLNPGLTTELGGEFVDSTHKEMMALVREFDFEWLDMQSPGEEKLVREAFYFNGTNYSEAQAVEGFRPLAARIKMDHDKLGEVVNFETEGGGAELDHTSLADYLDQIGAQGWMRKLLDIAFLTEFGRECHEQSCLNMIFMIGTDLSAGKLELFGESDERYKVAGGNQRVVDELAHRVQDQIHLDQKLVALKARDQGFTLVFDQGGRTNEVNADFVILTLPFTLLREVDLRVELPAWKKKAIAELGYGLNAKLLLGMKKRIWRDQGQSGNIFSDEPFQLAWDNSRLQGGDRGGITCYTGGKASDELKNGTPQDQAQRMLPALERPFPGITAQFNGKAERFHWPTHPFTKASYACYRPGQWTTIAGAEGKPVGNLFFAGEHCSYDFQGFMNGGAETGKQAAADLRKALRRWKRTAVAA